MSPLALLATPTLPVCGAEVGLAGAALKDLATTTSAQAPWRRLLAVRQVVRPVILPTIHLFNAVAAVAGSRRGRTEVSHEVGSSIGTVRVGHIVANVPSLAQVDVIWLPAVAAFDLINLGRVLLREGAKGLANVSVIADRWVHGSCLLSRIIAHCHAVVNTEQEGLGR
jgi:hypothetical protein